ncbi:hypothetical protein MgSA37_00384 [Mucilaginibacter gotjawali]|uniref:Uncharacterized protein n=2 Tax=Mucilaginibacter gotjawali TaxID=1550579 RepID=A0A839SLE2_9SPHI|nr:hypothetical protein [Mucilaginibacter gotjawali]BAU52234.1 hypothetical protein MgSA37_00384 [Mucilaginibacter gotjawali]
MCITNLQNILYNIQVSYGINSQNTISPFSKKGPFTLNYGPNRKLMNGEKVGWRKLLAHSSWLIVHGRNLLL